jgi:hypothetical protein
LGKKRREEEEEEEAYSLAIGLRLHAIDNEAALECQRQDFCFYIPDQGKPRDTSKQAKLKSVKMYSIIGEQ